MLTVAGFGVIASSIWGQCLQSLSDGVVSQEIGLVIIILPAICITFTGCKALHLHQRWAWIPVIFALFVLVGYGRKGLQTQTPTAPATAPQVNNTSELSIRREIASLTIFSTNRRP
jgi:purine-cytosine permease-like protein